MTTDTTESELIKAVEALPAANLLYRDDKYVALDDVIALIRQHEYSRVHETGLSPRELAEQRKELLEALLPFATLADEADKFGHEENSTCQWRIRASDLRKARAAIHRAKGDPVLAV